MRDREWWRGRGESGGENGAIGEYGGDENKRERNAGLMFENEMI